MGARLHVPWLGVAVPLGDGVGDDPGGGVAVGDVLGMGTTLPTGPGEGRGPTGGFGLVAGTSTWSSFLHARPVMRMTAPRARHLKTVALNKGFMGFAEFKPWKWSERVRVRSLNKHGIAVAVETVARVDGRGVGPQNGLTTRERRDEEEE